MNNPRKHIEYYVSLAIILLLSMGVVLAVNTSKQLQMLGVIMMAFFYCLWGIMHHHIHHSGGPKVVIEYVAIAVFGITIMLFFVKGGLL